MTITALSPENNAERDFVMMAFEEAVRAVCMGKITFPLNSADSEYIKQQTYARYERGSNDRIKQSEPH